MDRGGGSWRMYGYARGYDAQTRGPHGMIESHCVLFLAMVDQLIR